MSVSAMVAIAIVVVIVVVIDGVEYEENEENEEACRIGAGAIAEKDDGGAKAGSEDNVLVVSGVVALSVSVAVADSVSVTLEGVGTGAGDADSGGSQAPLRTRALVELEGPMCVLSRA